jgi:HlyD family secretion protein
MVNYQSSLTIWVSRPVQAARPPFERAQWTLSGILLTRAVAWALMLLRAFRLPALAASVGLFVVCLAGCAGATRHHRGFGGPGVQNVPLSTAAPATVRPTVQIAGIIAPYQNVSLSSSLSEPTDSVNVIQGDTVRRGEVLAVLDTTDLRAEYEAAEHSAVSADARAAQAKYQAQLSIGQGGDQVGSARAAVLQAQAALSQANQDLGRYQALLTGGYISQQQFDQQRTLVDSDRQQVASSQAALRSAELNQRVNGSTQKGLQAATVAAAIADAKSAHAQADQIAAQIARATIVSPVDGVVVNRNLNPGEYPGSRTIFTIQQLDPVYAELNASSSQVFLITRGSPVKLDVAGISGASYEGRVSAVLGQVEPGSTNFTVEAIASNPGDRLQSGMAVTGTITLPAVRGIGIPVSAFLDASHDSVMIESANGTAEQRPVKELGDNGTTAIVSGLAAGTHVVSNGQLGIVAGQPLTASAAKAAPQRHSWHGKKP